MKTYSIHPRITFQDTNVVGNVYFLTFFRWQQECRDRWLRDERPDLWGEINTGVRNLLLTHWETRFSDPFGATIGDQIEVALAEPRNEFDGLSLSTEVFCTKGNARVRIASGLMTHLLNCNSIPINGRTTDDHEYSMIAEVLHRQPITMLELLSWQGKCRELFLADHSPDVLRQVVDRQLILQTTSASVDLLQPSPAEIEQVRIEMRLASIKCGQMTVRFDYYAKLHDGNWKQFATGSQVMSSKYSDNSPSSLPVDLLLALRDFTKCKILCDAIDDILINAPRRHPAVTAQLTIGQQLGASS